MTIMPIQSVRLLMVLHMYSLQEKKKDGFITNRLLSLHYTLFSMHAEIMRILLVGSTNVPAPALPRIL